MKNQLKHTLLRLLFNKKQNIQGQIKVLQKTKKETSLVPSHGQWTSTSTTEPEVKMNLSCETMEEIRYAISVQVENDWFCKVTHCYQCYISSSTLECLKGGNDMFVSETTIQKSINIFSNFPSLFPPGSVTAPLKSIGEMHNITFNVKYQLWGN